MLEFYDFREMCIKLRICHRTANYYIKSGKLAIDLQWGHKRYFSEEIIDALASKMLEDSLDISIVYRGGKKLERKGELLPSHLAGKMVGITSTRINQLIRKGILPAIKIGSRNYIERDSLEKYMAKRKNSEKTYYLGA